LAVNVFADDRTWFIGMDDEFRLRLVLSSDGRLQLGESKSERKA
jgi:hypothetical protein